MPTSAPCFTFKKAYKGGEGHPRTPLPPPPRATPLWRLLFFWSLKEFVLKLPLSLGYSKPNRYVFAFLTRYSVEKQRRQTLSSLTCTRLQDYLKNWRLSTHNCSPTSERKVSRSHFWSTYPLVILLVPLPWWADNPVVFSWWAVELRRSKSLALFASQFSIM